MPSWITPLLVIVVFGTLLWLKARHGKRRLTRQIMLASVSESIGAVHSLLFFINVCYQWSTGERALLGVFKLPNSYLITAFYVLVIFLEFVSKTWKRK
jgi:hypothetical protein